MAALACRLRRVVVAVTVGIVASVGLIPAGPAVSMAGLVRPANAMPPGFFWKDRFVELCQSGCAANSGPQVQFWQTLLWADNIGGRIGNTAFIDGQFGPTTAARTRDWQAYPYHIDFEGRRLAVDGRVGPRTWSAADRNNVPNACAEQPNGGEFCVYLGRGGRDVAYGRSGATGFYYFWNPRLGRYIHLLP